MIRFYFHHTPNPMKVALFLEETGMRHEVHAVDTLKGEQHSAAFRRVNPNGKTPAITDTDGVGGETHVFDSSAILLYLGEKSGQYMGTPAERGQLLSWMMFIGTGLGPYFGQGVHFTRVAPEPKDYAVNRYRREAERHYQVLDEQLAGREHIATKDYSIVDMSAWGWIDRAPILFGEGGLDRFANVKRWFDMVNARPAAARARLMGKDLSFKKEMDEDARRHLYPSNYPAAVAAE